MTSIAEAFDLTDRVAIVTGAGRGLGRAIATRLAEAGATVVGADIDDTTAADTAAAIERAGHRASAAHLDVTKKAEVDALVDRVVADHGHLDVMVNNAAIIVDSLVIDTTEADLDRVMAVNFKGVFFGCQAAGRAMALQGSGSIINLASGAARRTRPGLVTYSITKAGVWMLTRGLALELAPDGIRVNAIGPGVVASPMTHRIYGSPAGVAERGQTVPLGRVGQPLDIAHTAVFLASDESSFYTGSLLHPDGGSLIAAIQ